ALLGQHSKLHLRLFNGRWHLGRGIPGQSFARERYKAVRIRFFALPSHGVEIINRLYAKNGDSVELSVIVTGDDHTSGSSVSDYFSLGREGVGVRNAAPSLYDKLNLTRHDNLYSIGTRDGIPPRRRSNAVPPALNAQEDCSGALFSFLVD